MTNISLFKKNFSNVSGNYFFVGLHLILRHLSNVGSKSDEENKNPRIVGVKILV